MIYSLKTTCIATRFQMIENEFDIFNLLIMNFLFTSIFFICFYFALRTYIESLLHKISNYIIFLCSNNFKQV